MSYRQIEGTTIEVPDWVQVPAFAEFSEAKLAKSRLAIAYIRNKYFGSDVKKRDAKAKPISQQKKTKPQPL
ncbi:MAG: hypothetical protein LRY75_10810 [Shewanella xiamenensis]|nr:hypothetical protein [Shewanella xiamenensis]